jgi:membrane-bound lytic murein transglycosylase B
MRLPTRWTHISITLFCLFALMGQASADAKFKNWLNGFYSTAAKSGITRATYNKAFKGVTAPDPRVLKKARFQPEFRTKIWDYVDAKVNPYSLGEGLKKKAEHGSVLAAIENHFGVDRHILLSIWSAESSYGAVFSSKDKLFNATHDLATLAYADRKRAKYARQQLISALKIIQKGDIGPDDMYGSWAGALGQTQFIPTSYDLYAIDADGDGKKDIWRSVPDTLATAANLLKKNGWRTGETWGYETIAHRSGYKYNGQTKTLAQWSKLGFKRTKGRSFTRGAQRAELKYLAGSEGPAFLMTRNFFVIKKYNNANSYALSIGLLADRLAGGSRLSQRWPRPANALNVDEKVDLQKGLAKLRLYKGEFDGNIGSGSRASIARFQKKYRLPVDEKASQTLLKAVKKAAKMK